MCLLLVTGCVQQFPGAAAPVVHHDGCHVHGKIVSTAWQRSDGRVERAIVNVWTVPQPVRVQEIYGRGEQFELWLAPGKYQLEFSANGSQGATFQVLTRDITVEANQDDIDLGEIDLPISKSTSLYGQPAPEFDGIAAWQDTLPLSLKGLRGHVIVLDFFAYYCTICHAHKPDLLKLRDKYQRQGLVVLALHDNSVHTLDEMNEKMRPVWQHMFPGDPPHIPIALDGPGERSVFKAYGIHAVPAVILIDQSGRVVRRYHHAGVPELEADIRDLLIIDSKWRL